MVTQLPITDCSQDASSSMSLEDAQRLATTFKVLADPVRLRLLYHIGAKCCSSTCVCHMPEELGISQPTLSYHLGKLAKAGLISKRMKHKWAHYQATPEGLRAVRNFLDALPDPGVCKA